MISNGSTCHKCSPEVTLRSAQSIQGHIKVHAYGNDVSGHDLEVTQYVFQVTKGISCLHLIKIACQGMVVKG